ncbi:MAG: ATP-binding cassette domain-containing protein [Deltaproteobacteria bacterium]|nr:ATP-binding cassette domain-containing protein [Deltaproteobacteria bacterium]
MVEARSLCKDYGPTRALSDLSFTISRGEVVGFLGPNGAGKTTTMKILTGFLRPTRGKALVGGVDVAEDSLTTRRRIGYLPESAPLYGDMMVLDFLRYVAELRAVPHAVRDERLRNIAKRCGLLEVLGKDIGQLSKGFRQRVGLAQALVHDPDLVILDEPTSGLDPNQIVEIRDLIKEIGKEKTVLLSTHILPEVHATCRRVIIISDGKLVADDTPEALAEREAGGLLRVVLKGKGDGAAPELEKVRGILAAVPGIRAVESGESEGGKTLGFRVRPAGNEDPREALFAASVAHDLVLLEMHREAVSLEETFRRLTRGDGGAHA